MTRSQRLGGGDFDFPFFPYADGCSSLFNSIVFQDFMAMAEVNRTRQGRKNDGRACSSRREPEHAHPYSRNGSTQRPAARKREGKAAGARPGSRERCGLPYNSLFPIERVRVFCSEFVNRGAIVESHHPWREERTELAIRLARLGCLSPIRKGHDGSNKPLRHPSFKGSPAHIEVSFT